ncbi:MAG: response regulator [Bdellovibrionota bacterium]
MPHNPRLQNTKILIAEDAPEIREMLTFILSEIQGAEVATAINGKEAVEMAGRVPFDLILMDLTMPEMDGPTATKAIRRTGSTVPILALSGRLLQEGECPEGFDGHIPKPFDISNMLNLVVYWTQRNRPGSSTVAS